MIYALRFKFFILDSLAWKVARQEIGDSMTVSAGINFFKPILVEDFDNFNQSMDIISKSSSSITMFWKLEKNWEIYVSWTFSFVKIKKISLIIFFYFNLCYLFLTNSIDINLKFI